MATRGGSGLSKKMKNRNKQLMEWLNGQQSKRKKVGRVSREGNGTGVVQQNREDNNLQRGYTTQKTPGNGRKTMGEMGICTKK
jgi:hypothetical protein